MSQDSNFELGDILKCEDIEYEIVGDDSQSTQHPGGHKKFDYILRRLDTNETIRPMKSEMSKFTIVSHLEIPSCVKEITFTERVPSSTEK